MTVAALSIAGTTLHVSTWQGLNGVEDLGSHPLPTGEPARQGCPPFISSPRAPVLYCLHALAGLVQKADGISFQAALAVTLRTFMTVLPQNGGSLIGLRLGGGVNEVLPLP